MTEIFICLLSGIMSIIGLYIGSHLNKQNTDKEITQKRFEFYKPLYFQLCVGKLDLESAILEITSLNNRIHNNMNDYLLLDSKTRRYLIKICHNSNITTWDEKTFINKTEDLVKSTRKEFIKIQGILGYPVSRVRHAVANLSFGTTTFSITGFFMVNDLAKLVNNNETIISIYILSLTSIFLISLYVFIKNIHYIGNY